MKMKKKVLDTALIAGASGAHIGGALSIIDIIATLYCSIMRHDKKNPEWTERDRFILSKGHGCLAYYSALAEAGYIESEELNTFEKSGSDLLGHPVINRKKGIEFSNGSLGMGLSLGIGVALAGKRGNKNFKVYVILGDGECNEGSVWEAAMAAPNFELNNLCAIIDKNNFQQTGANKDIMNVGNLHDKWLSFGWNVKEIDGHNINEIYETLKTNSLDQKPLVIVANTIKGKGFSFSENNNDWHHTVLSKSQYDLAIKELNSQNI